MPSMRRSAATDMAGLRIAALTPQRSAAAPRIIRQRHATIIAAISTRRTRCSLLFERFLDLGDELLDLVGPDEIEIFQGRGRATPAAQRTKPNKATAQEEEHTEAVASGAQNPLIRQRAQHRRL